MGIEVIENRLFHENHKEAGDLCIRPIGVAVPLVAGLVVGEGVELVHLVLHVGREGGERLDSKRVQRGKRPLPPW